MSAWEKFMEFCNTPIWCQESIKFDTKEEMVAFLEATGRARQAREVKANPKKDVDLVEWKMV